MIVFRLAHKETGISLPLHWSYGDPFEQEYDEEYDRWKWIDLREEGMQVWGNPARMLGAASGAITVDGDYGAEEYPTILVIEADALQDSVGEWYAVLPDDVLSLRAISTATAVSWSIDAATASDGEDEVDLADWLLEHEDEVRDYLISNSRSVAISFTETLPFEHPS